MKPIDMMMRKYHDKQRKIRFSELQQKIKNRENYNSLNIFTESNSQGLAMIDMAVNINNESQQIINESQLLKSYLESFSKKQKDNEDENENGKIEENHFDQNGNTIQELYDLLNAMEMNDLSLLSCDEYESPDEKVVQKLLESCKQNKKLQKLSKIEGIE